MNQVFYRWTRDFSISGDIRRDALNLLRIHNMEHTAEHTERVAKEAVRIAEQFRVDPDAAKIAALLHDISGIIPNSERLSAAKLCGLAPYPEEEIFPMIIHQRLSAVMARELFGITDPGILGAIGCHTTLRAQATDLDLVMFVADKIEWDQRGTPPYLADLQAALSSSLGDAAFVYLDYLWSQREKLRVVHPWLLEAYKERSRA
ncbi:bis(5'-nucleosyl)-tetraphosphatase (symmetrical) YqeK [Brevibacillus ruminantium]|uniref:bis(5'-nucleosyl)-tetraphosphatase (symmetrical) n=1 Tax=Brevibacillus ruminantium TaxID=2950604 RepID=A0ABY4WKQ8_9BACL|nr:bis(5'-nucleosyl)-tetraphosphatase (symmetrical) YqeK [Brevibacillus ruminantium]USG67259.1 bis(5'-nucleosyl)-tetraphosphatase (symmetrical) YqeK [Brevibacillus ruminantium]